MTYTAAIGFRNRWRSYAGLVALLGLFGGLSLFALAGARRTQSSYPQFLRAAHASTMTVAAGDPRLEATIAKLPEVVRLRSYRSFRILALAHGVPDFTQDFEPVGTLDGEYFDQDRFTPTQGRRPDPERADEVAVNEEAARRNGYHVGQRIELATFSDAQASDPDFRVHPTPPKVRTSARVVGVGVFPDEVLQDEADRLSRLLLTPAFTRISAPYAIYEVLGLQLAHGDRDVAAVKQGLGKIIPVGLLRYRVTSVDEFHALQALRPLSIALFAFGVLAGLAGLVLVVQGIGRVMRTDRDQRTALRAFGASPVGLAGAACTGPALAVMAGTVWAVLLATVASPIMPVGPVRRVQGPVRFDFDATVMVLGALFIVTALWGATLVIALVEARQRVRRPARQPRRRRISTRASDAGLGPVAVTGLSFALGSADAGATATAQSVMVGAAVAVAALVASIVFGGSSDRLVHRPALYGWRGNTALLAGRGYGNIPRAEAATILDHDTDVESWAGAYFGRDTINGSSTPLLGMDIGSPLLPPLLHGRPLRRSDEIVLGSATAAQIHKGVGDTVTLAGTGAARSLTIVGISTFPTIGTISVAHTSLGVGALVEHQLVPGFDRDIRGNPSGDPGPQVIFVRFRPGTQPTVGMTRLAAITRSLADRSYGLEVEGVQRPVEISSLGSVSGAPLVLAAGLAGGAMIWLGLALGTAVRRRRRDLAILKSIGFTGRQLAGTVSWLATTMIVVGLFAGVPLGVVIGRALWDVFAGQLDVVAAPSVPVPTLIGLGSVTIVIANVIATLPARGARRIDAARLLQRQ